MLQVSAYATGLNIGKNHTLFTVQLTMFCWTVVIDKLAAGQIADEQAVRAERVQVYYGKLSRLMVSKLSQTSLWAMRERSGKNSDRWQTRSVR